MKKIILLISIVLCTVSHAQKNTKTTTIDVVQILNNNKKEAIYYYKNNWEILRKMALKKDYIHTYKLLETTPTTDAPYNFILMTTYKNQQQFMERERHFQELIKIKGTLNLLNHKKPSAFRKTMFTTEAQHIEH